MTRDDILGFVELLPLGDDDDVWEVVAAFLASEVVKRLGDLDPKMVLTALCNVKAEEPAEEAEDKEPAEEAEDKEPAEEAEDKEPAEEADEPAEPAEEKPADEAKPTGADLPSYGSGAGHGFGANG